ncbi:MAG: hypothetical protein Q9209_007152 [Squamulea sp. 1 TL-2023]
MFSRDGQIKLGKVYNQARYWTLLTTDPANIGDSILDGRLLTEATARNDIRSVGLVMVELMEPESAIRKPAQTHLARPEAWKDESGIKDFLDATRSEPLVALRKREQTISSPAAILLSNIPTNLLDSRKIHDIFKVFAPDLQGVLINRDCKALSRIIHLRDTAIEALETALTNEIAYFVREQERLDKYRTTRRPLIIQIADSLLSQWGQFYLKGRIHLYRLVGLPCRRPENEVTGRLKQSISEANRRISKLQTNPDQLPPLSSAFVVFSNTRTAELASRLLVLDRPRQMTLQFVGCSAESIIWPAVGVSWFSSHIRTLVVTATLAALCIGWTIPVAFTGVISQITYLTSVLPWLEPLNDIPSVVIGTLQGFAPQATLILLTALLPLLIRLLVQQQGFIQGSDIELSIQTFYFWFLFLQVFLTVSVSSSLTTIIGQFWDHPASLPSMIATNIPKTSNYFFSYLLLQGLSLSGGRLLQLVDLLSRVVLGYLFDVTPRQITRRSRKVQYSQWGTVFPVFTNLACIVFGVIAFGLFLFVFRYSILFVIASYSETNGRLYLVALQQLFVGIYVMELYLVGLFALIRDSMDHFVCLGQVSLMVVIIGATAIFQHFLYKSFRPFAQQVPSHATQTSLSTQANNSATEKQVPDMQNKWQDEFTNDSLKPRPTVVWIPEDGFGISTGKLNTIKTELYGVLATSDKASVGRNAKIKISGLPPYLDYGTPGYDDDPKVRRCINVDFIIDYIGCNIDYITDRIVYYINCIVDRVDRVDRINEVIELHIECISN